MLVAVALTPTEGAALTVTVVFAVEVHPLTSVPVTVYVVVEAGASLTGDPDKDPGIQEYVDAPVAESEVLSPEQIVAGIAEAFTVGSGLTVIVIVSVLVHPLPSSPVTV